MTGSAEVVRLHATVTEQGVALAGQAAAIARLTVENAALSLAFVAMKDALVRSGAVEMERVRAAIVPVLEALAARAAAPMEVAAFEGICAELGQLLADPELPARQAGETAH